MWSVFEERWQDRDYSSSAVRIALSIMAGCPPIDRCIQPMFQYIRNTKKIETKEIPINTNAIEPKTNIDKYKDISWVLYNVTNDKLVKKIQIYGSTIH